MSHLVKKVMRSGALALVAALVVPAIAAADAPDVTPNSMSASSVQSGNSVTVTVKGSWQWTTHKSNCNTDRAGVGVAIDWNDTKDPGYVVTTLNGVTIDVGSTKAGDNAVHPTLGSTFTCGSYNGTYNTGDFGTGGEFSHTYSADALPSSICALTYDVHGKPGVPNGTKETTAGGSSNNDDNSAQKNGATPSGNICASVPIIPPPPPPPPPGCTSNCTPAPQLPVIAIDKSGPATALAGTAVPYTLVVTDPGPTAFPAATVAVTDPLCSSAPSLVTKNNDGSPDVLNPGDSWTYTCSVTTQLGQDAIHNTGNVTGTDTNGRQASASDTADTVLNQPASGVAPLLPGVARLRGPTGCISNATHVLTVRGKRIARVSFYVDGRYVGTRTKPNSGSAYTVTVRGSRLRTGAHRVIARVTYLPDTNPRSKTLTLAFARCARAVTPKFTG
jgi:hypothetical protein